MNWTSIILALCDSIALESWIAFNNNSKNAIKFQELHFGQYPTDVETIPQFLSLLLVVFKHPSAFHQRRVITTMNSIINHFIIFISFFSLFGNYRNIKKKTGQICDTESIQIEATTAWCCFWSGTGMEGGVLWTEINFFGNYNFQFVAKINILDCFASPLCL